MNLNFLDFEQPIAELEAKIEELRMVTDNSSVNVSDEISRLQAKSRQLTKDVFSKLTPWQITQLARHPQRPHTVDYIPRIFTEFDELQGDRALSKGATIVGGIARFEGQPVVVIGHEKLPIFTFIDTPGAYPGIGAEERNQSEAIARNLFVLSRLKTPIICTVTGEGGSGGALAIGVGDRVLMLQYSIYSVISPEGCASILWKSADKASQAAEAMGVSAEQNLRLGLIDQIIPEPLGGAHREFDAMAITLKKTLSEQLAQLQSYPINKLLDLRYQRLMSYGMAV